ncbi:MAG TPA: tetratricopeptide repeat protein [Candidatus Acidoferrum sp.]|nr:tetratricopeptide repeat protein [Candidatus Acidoferrum sp.]
MKRFAAAHALSATSVFSLLIVTVVFAAARSPQTAKLQAQAGAPVSFTRDIAPIVFRSCAPCHHSGEAGPFPLLTYGDVKSHARQIADVTRKRLMPPWLPSTDGLPFEEDAHLSEHDIALFQKWLDDGLHEGNSNDLPPVPKFTSGWQLGQPDLVLHAASPFTIPASGSDVYWNFVFRPPLKSSRFIKAIEIHPGDKRLVHHANLLVDRTQSARRQEKSPGSGFPGMELQIESDSFDPDGHFFFWKPGSPPIVEPPGFALRLDTENDLVLNTHLQPSGKPEAVQPTVGIYFTDEPATRFPVLLQIENDRALDIPAGDGNFIVSDEFTLPENVQLLALYPHAHYLCRDMLALARLPGGSEKTLIHIPRWDLNWQAVFRLAQPEPLPRGTTLVMRYRYDNSSDNIANPNNPPQRVTAGNRAVDEMAHLWLQVLPETQPGQQRDPRMVLQEALARHHIENNPADFEAHYNLAAMLQARGAGDDAVLQYQSALDLRPGDATVENALGAALLSSGKIPDAIKHLHAATTARPEYFDARYNLGIALASAGDFARAAQEFAAAAKLKPGDSGAEANLGAALAELGQKDQAIAHFQRALQLDPQNQLALENLDTLQKAP